MKTSRLLSFLWVPILLSWTDSFGMDGDLLRPALSPIRNLGESFEQASTRALKEMADAGFETAENGTALAEGTAYEVSQLATLPQWDNLVAAQQEFLRVRNMRFLISATHPGFLRRLPWLYPDDGCFVRAQSVVELLSPRYPTAQKVFVYGNLSMPTRYAPNKVITWWYHVAPGIRVGNQPYIFDPTVEQTSLLKLNDWIYRMGAQPGQVRLAICSSTAYDPQSQCEGSSMDVARLSAQRDRPSYLDAEWNRLTSLGMDSVRLLGDSPPW